MPRIEERLAFLEARLAVLEEESSEALEANYLTYDPATGLVGASFNGKIHATGLTLDTGASLADMVAWLRPSDGKIVSLLEAQVFAAGRDQAVWSTGDPDSPPPTHVNVTENVDATTLGQTFLSVDITSALAGVLPIVTIYDDLGRSSFVQTSSLVKRNLAFGSSLVNFAAATSANVTVAPGLTGLTVIGAVATATAGLWDMTCHVDTFGVNTFRIVATTTAAITAANVPIFWMAWA